MQRSVSSICISRGDQLATDETIKFPPFEEGQGSTSLQSSFKPYTLVNCTETPRLNPQMLLLPKRQDVSETLKRGSVAVVQKNGWPHLFFPDCQDTITHNTHSRASSRVWEHKSNIRLHSPANIDSVSPGPSRVRHVCHWDNVQLAIVLRADSLGL